VSDSLDEAVALIPTGCPWVIEYFNSTEMAATVYSSEAMERKWSVFASSPADALRQAAAKAREALGHFQ
jgi:hypothetical protein